MSYNCYIPKPMKPVYLFILMAFFTFQAKSQTFLQNNKVWNVVRCINGGACETESFKIAGDTLLGLYNYKKLYSTYDSTLAKWNPYGALREDGNKIYFYLYANQTEVLLYDFGLAVGERFQSVHNSPEVQNCPIDLEVLSTDTVTLENGLQAKRIIFTDGEQWLYGVGSLYGLVYTGIDQCILDNSYELSCCSLDYQLLYDSPDFEKCYINTLGVKKNGIENSVSVFPNPFSRHAVLKFNNSEGSVYALKIVNSLGQTVKRMNNIHGASVDISAGTLKGGIYYYFLIKKGKIVAKGKFTVIK